MVVTVTSSPPAPPVVLAPKPTGPLGLGFSKLPLLELELLELEDALEELLLELEVLLDELEELELEELEELDPLFAGASPPHPASKDSSPNANKNCLFIIITTISGVF